MVRVDGQVKSLLLTYTMCQARVANQAINTLVCKVMLLSKTQVSLVQFFSSKLVSQVHFFRKNHVSQVQFFGKAVTLLLMDGHTDTHTQRQNLI